VENHPAENRLLESRLAAIEVVDIKDPTRAITKTTGVIGKAESIVGRVKLGREVDIAVTPMETVSKAVPLAIVAPLAIAVPMVIVRFGRIVRNAMKDRNAVRVINGAVLG
jgi:hypothetical protein